MKLHPQARIPFLKRGDTRIGSAGFWNELIKTVNAIRSLRVRSGSKNNFIISDDNAELTIIGGEGNEIGGGWEWIGEFNSLSPYEFQNVVLVSPGNSAEGAVISGSKTVLAGIYVCLQTVTGGITAQYPCWPLPNNTISNASNFWMLLSLYPTEMTYCVDGVNTQYFVNAQPAPVAP